MHDANAVAHGDRLLLVVSDVNEGDADLALEILEFELHLLAEFQVESTQRFIQQEHLGPVHQCPGQGHSLLLTA